VAKTGVEPRPPFPTLTVTTGRKIITPNQRREKNPVWGLPYLVCDFRLKTVT
jgi:hypothetical protein